MKRIGLFSPCWSCEGHLGQDQTLWKLPRVWFFCHSMTHLRLLVGGLRELDVGRKLSARWQTVVTCPDTDNTAATFSLEPDPVSSGPLRLTALRQDVLVIADALTGMIARQAAALLRKKVKT
jgi:hypothetical protein